MWASVAMLALGRLGSAGLLAQVGRQESEYRRYLATVQAELVGDASLTRRLAQDAVVSLAEAHVSWLARCRELLIASETRVA